MRAAHAVKMAGTSLRSFARPTSAERAAPHPILRRPLAYWFQRLTYQLAANETDFAALSSSVLIARAGAPTISEFGGNSLPSVTSAPAPTSEFGPIFAPFSTIAPCRSGCLAR